mmetsp:Transcript_26522/g.47628  ORF Transcript_26522/g.47628 Transcript_26522/m.47628 type:complete len:415 (+) Transcript_26522:1811-3055(+)
MLSRSPAEPETDEQGHKIITEAYLRKLCAEQEMYETPKFNDRLYLHFKGFIDIRNLEAYYNLKAIWLESNCISKIENLRHLTSLRFLYLQNNSISKIENLESLVSLVAINLTHNRISVIENLSSLKSLEDLTIANNRIQDPTALRGLIEAPALATVDLSSNLIEELGDILETLKAMPSLQCLYLKGNKVVRHISMYRKVLISGIKSLKYLDDRPVSEVERLGCDAWLRGGKDEEMAVRHKYHRDQEDAMRANMKLMKRYEVEGIRKRQEAIAKAEAGREAERKAIAEQRRKALEAQTAQLDDIINELDRKEAELNKEVDIQVLIEPVAKCSVTVRTGKYDSFGDLIVEDKPPAKPKVDSLNESDIKAVLIKHFFDFTRATEELSETIEVNEAQLREAWTSLTLANQPRELDELD